MENHHLSHLILFQLLYVKIGFLLLVSSCLFSHLLLWLTLLCHNLNQGTRAA